MLIESGHYFLVFSALLSFTQSSFFLALCVGTFTLSLFCLFASYGCSDFSVMNVFVNSNQQLPFFYKISAAWSNHEGSMLLWAWICCFFCIMFLIRSRQSAQATQSKPHLVFNVIVLYFCLFLLATSNPYLRISLISPEAQAELNPVLQDPILAIHPPLIYAGYVASAIGFGVCLCVCVQSYTSPNHSHMLYGLKERLSAKRQAGLTLTDSSLLFYSQQKKLNKFIAGLALSVQEGYQDWGWKEIRVWILLCWCFLTVGILLGSWWAYHELGWGGWWFWDPVENASFMPWILATGCVHSVLYAHNKLWTVFFSFATFLLSLLGTFFVRSGFLASVHSFASDNSRGIFFLIFCSGLLILCIAVFYRFWHINRPTQALYSFSTKLLGKKAAESLTTTQSLFALVICAIVLCGTAAPVLFSLVFGRDVSAGAPFFNGTIIPIVAALLQLCILAQVENRSLRNLSFLSIVFILNTTIASKIGGLALLESVFFSIAFSLFQTLLLQHRTSMQLAHGGLCAFVAGIVFSNSYKSQATIMLQLGDGLYIDQKTFFLLRGVDQLYGPTFQSICANLSIFVQPKHSISQSNDFILNNTGFLIFPEKRFYYLQADSSTTKVAVQTNGLSDVYALIGTGNFETGWYTTVMKLPFITCIWIGFFVSSLGGFLSFCKQLRMPWLFWTA